jgi:hypothetical protein
MLYCLWFFHGHMIKFALVGMPRCGVPARAQRAEHRVGQAVSPVLLSAALCGAVIAAR